MTASCLYKEVGVVLNQFRSLIQFRLTEVISVSLCLRYSLFFIEDVPLATQPTTNATASADMQSNVAAATATAAPTAARVPCPPTQSQPLAPGYTRTPPALFTVANSSHAPHFLTTGKLLLAYILFLNAVYD